jgi:hypothetical protein
MIYLAGTRQDDLVASPTPDGASCHTRAGPVDLLELHGLLNRPDTRPLVQKAHDTLVTESVRPMNVST